MGVRPSMYLVIGVSNLIEDDPRYTKQFHYPDEDLTFMKPVKYYECDNFSDKHYNMMNVPGYQFSELGEIIYNTNNSQSHVCPNVTGMIIDEIEDTDILRALSLLYPEFNSSGYKDIPTKKELSEFRKRACRITEEDFRCNRLVDTRLVSIIEESRENWKRAVFYLRQCGYEFREDELKYILVWDWS